MPYVKRVSTTLIEMNSQILATADITAIASEIDLPVLTIPAFKGKIDSAYIDVYGYGREDYSVANNYLAANSKIGIKDTGGTYHNCATLPATLCDTPASTRVYAPFCFKGYINIANYITSGADQLPCLKDIAAHGTGLQLYEVYATLRMYFNL